MRKKSRDKVKARDFFAEIHVNLLCTHFSLTTVGDLHLLCWKRSESNPIVTDSSLNLCE